MTNDDYIALVIDLDAEREMIGQYDEECADKEEFNFDMEIEL